MRMPNGSSGDIVVDGPHSVFIEKCAIPSCQSREGRDAFAGRQRIPNDGTEAEKAHPTSMILL